jgi:hypothetical protein
MVQTHQALMGEQVVLAAAVQVAHQQVASVALEYFTFSTRMETL